MLKSLFNPLSAPTQPASVPVGGIARVTQMLGRVANRVRTALTRTKAATHAPKQAPNEAKAPTRRKPHPATPHIDDDLIAEFCASETIGEIFASFCRIINIDEKSPLYPAKLIAITQTPEQFAATRQPDSAKTKPRPPRPTHVPPSQVSQPPATLRPVKQRTAPPGPPTKPNRTRNHPTPPGRTPTRATRTHDPPKKRANPTRPITP